MAGGARISKPGFLGQGWAGGFRALQASGPPRCSTDEEGGRCYSFAWNGFPSLRRPCAFLALPLSPGLGTLWDLGWLVHLPWGRSSNDLWRRGTKGTWEEASAPQSFEDFFASLENEHPRVSISSLLFHNQLSPKLLDCLHYYLKVQVQLTEKKMSCVNESKQNSTT